MKKFTHLIIILVVLSMFSQISTSDSPREDISGTPPVDPMQSPVTFTDVAATSGFSGIGGTFFSWGDYNNDGYEDLLVNGRKIYRNNGPPNWDFTDVSAAAGIVGGAGNGVWADYDNDGCLDFFANKLWRSNCDGTFTNMTEAAGHITIDWPYGAAGWGDYDRDGYLDLYATGSEGPSGVYHPDMFWHNNGDGTFTEVGTYAFGNGLTWKELINPLYGRGVAWADYNNDGWLDIYITNYRQKFNYLWENDKDGTFTDVAIFKGVFNGAVNLTNNPDPCNNAGHGVGSAWGDYDNDGDLDLYVGNLNHKDWRTSDDSLLYRNEGSGAGYSFTNVRGEAGMHIKPYDVIGPWGDGTCSGSPSHPYPDPGWIWPGPEGDELIMEGVWGDFDNDGWLDLWTPQIYDISYTYAYLYHNNQNGTFEDVAVSAGVHDVYDTYGGAWADYDNDGDLDLVTGARSVGGSGAPKNIMLFRNEMYNPVSNQLNNSWLKVKLKGCANSCAIGARVNVTNGSIAQIREVEAGTGAHSQQNSMVLIYGFGSYYGNVDVSVRWPSGVVSSLIGVALNQTLNLMEANCTAPPTNTTASFWGADNGDLNITWNLSIDDGAGLDNVANYAIYHSNTSYDRSGMFYKFLAEVPNGTNFFNHSGKGMNDTENHFYLVIANSTLGFQVRGPQTAKISKFLQQGNNLISLPVSPYDNDISTVLQSVNYNSAWWFDATDTLDPWKSYNPLKSNNDLGTINHTMGVWINAVSDSYLMITGSVPTTTDIELKMGWNLIGYPSFKQDNISKALSAVPYERVEGFNSSVPERLQLCSESDIMNAGYGYWVKVSTDAILTIMQI